MQQQDRVPNGCPVKILDSAGRGVAKRTKDEADYRACDDLIPPNVGAPNSISLLFFLHLGRKGFKQIAAYFLANLVQSDCRMAAPVQLPATLDMACRMRKDLSLVEMVVAGGRK